MINNGDLILSPSFSFSILYSIMERKTLTLLLALFLMATVMAEDTNQMNGPGNVVISGASNLANGRDNTFDGSHNRADGNSNSFKGDHNRAEGDSNDIKGDVNDVHGKKNHVEG